MPLTALVGKWETTVVPPPRQAPMIAPSFTIAVKDGNVAVTFERQTQASEAKVIATRSSEEVSVLIIRYPSKATSSQTVMIRPTSDGRLRYELYVEYSNGQRNWYYEELFRKAKG